MRFELDLRQRVIADRVGASQMHVSRTLGHLTPVRPTG
jgi:DNA-directed RNA polymerase specialized sigma subunit